MKVFSFSFYFILFYFIDNQGTFHSQALRTPEQYEGFEYHNGADLGCWVVSVWVFLEIPTIEETKGRRRGRRRNIKAMKWMNVMKASKKLGKTLKYPFRIWYHVSGRKKERRKWFIT